MNRRRNNIAALLSATLLVLFAGLGVARTGEGTADSTAAVRDSVRTGYANEGVASWYGARFQGRRTASGERYNRHAMTCAHPTLPFGTKVRVTNVETGDQVIVRVNDRGPFVRSRIIDLSSAAAKAIGIAGCARVKIEEIIDEAQSDGAEPAIARASTHNRERKSSHRQQVDVAPEIDVAQVVSDSATTITQAVATQDSVVDSLAEITMPISPVASRFRMAIEPLSSGRSVRTQACISGVRIVDTNNRAVDLHGYTVVVAVTSHYSEAVSVRDALLARGYRDVHLVIASTCGATHYKVCIGFEPLPIACRRTAEFLVHDYPTVTISYISRSDDDQDQTTALAY